MTQTAKIDNTVYAIAASSLSLQEKIDWHMAWMRGLPEAMSSVLYCAVHFFNMGVNPHQTIPLPKGTTFQGRSEASFLEIIEGHHLEPYLTIFAEYLPASPLDVPLNNG